MGMEVTTLSIPPISPTSQREHPLIVSLACFECTIIKIRPVCYKSRVAVLLILSEFTGFMRRRFTIRSLFLG